MHPWKLLADLMEGVPLKRRTLLFRGAASEAPVLLGVPPLNSVQIRGPS